MFRKLLQSGWLTIGLLLVAGFMFVSLYRIIPSAVIAGRKLESLNKKVTELTQVEETSPSPTVSGEIDQRLDKLARLYLNYKKPDEHVVIIYSKNKETSVIEKSAGQPDAWGKFWQSVTDWINKK
ncbi:MAG: hypothetical protein CEN90_354 [Parcubacteria group bacterium Licking1014_17]|nr:MAG: hypothetical protein CEN90_354 [Parcubacteria group bacterium Licking1014_17]